MKSSGQLTEAADLFKKAAAESAGQAVSAQAALFHEAEVLTELALVEPDRIKEARDKLNRFLQSLSDQPPPRAARACQARLQLHAGDFAGAEAAIAELAKLPRGAERAAVLRTKILGKQGKHDEAIAQLDKLIAGYPKGSERQRAAMLAKAESLAAKKQYKEAETLLHEVIQGNPPEDAAAQAPAYNTLGDCLRAANRPKDALFAYLHTDLLYSKDKEEHPTGAPPDRRALSPAQAGRPCRRVRESIEARVSAQPVGVRQVAGAIGSATFRRERIFCRTDW